MLVANTPEQQAAVGRPLFLLASEWDGLITILSLPKRQTQIAAGLLNGLSEKEIAAALEIAPGTVHCYIGRLYLRLEVSSHITLAASLFAAYAQWQRDGAQPALTYLERISDKAKRTPLTRD